MQNSKSGWFISATVCLMMASVALAPVATADNGTSSSATSKPFIAEDQSYVILDVADSIETEDDQFYPTGDLPPDALIVFRDADGNLPGGLTEAGLAKLMEMEAQGLIVPDGSGAVELSPELVALVNGE